MYLFCSKIISKDETPPTVLSEEFAEQEPVTARHNGIQSQFKQYKSVQKVVNWIKIQPKHRLCQHKSSCVYYTLQIKNVQDYPEAFYSNMGLVR